MSNYKRLISYIYAYEGGVKGKNIGYAKLEVRGGQCRIQISVKKVYVGSSEIGVYLLAPGAELLLGRIFIRGGAGEFRMQIDTRNVEGSGLELEDFYGLTIHDVESAWQCYTTIWEDAVAQTAELQLAEVTAENAQKREPAEELKEESLLPISAEIEQELEKEEARQEATAPWDGAEPEVLAEAGELTAEEVAAEPESAEAEAEAGEQQEFVAEEAEAEAKQPSVAAEVIMEATAEATPEPEDSSEIQAQESAETGGSAMSAQNPAVQNPSAQNPSAQNPSAQNSSLQNPVTQNPADSAIQDPAQLEALDRQEQEDAHRNNLWNRLERLYTKVLAFEYENDCQILSIKPQDIGLLPREVWMYGNNSFLLHGYYNYRHLILARLCSGQGGPRYLLGVPGHYFSNEKHMASMFGFPHFVLAKKQPEGDGRFGYWYTDIRL